MVCQSIKTEVSMYVRSSKNIHNLISVSIKFVTLFIETLFTKQREHSLFLMFPKTCLSFYKHCVSLLFTNPATYGVNGVPLIMCNIRT